MSFFKHLKKSYASPAKSVKMSNFLHFTYVEEISGFNLKNKVSVQNQQKRILFKQKRYFLLDCRCVSFLKKAVYFCFILKGAASRKQTYIFAQISIWIQTKDPITSLHLKKKSIPWVPPLNASKNFLVCKTHVSRKLKLSELLLQLL